MTIPGWLSDFLATNHLETTAGKVVFGLACIALWAALVNGAWNAVMG